MILINTILIESTILQKPAVVNKCTCGKLQMEEVFDMESKKIEEIMQSYGVINVSYNGMPVWIEGIRGEVAEVTLIDTGRRMDVPVSNLTEEDPVSSYFEQFNTSD
jgi:H-type small acid-soluble spore protein